MKVKICGITRVEDAIFASECGADALGFIFYKKSKRYVENKTVKTIIDKLPPFLSTVGVFVNENIDFIRKTVEETGINIAQVHGEEDSDYVKELSKYVKVIKGFRIKDEKDIEMIKKYELSYFLIDAYSEKEYGGTGETFNWDIAKKVSEIGKIILAGGINETNIEKVKEEIKPYAVDLSSGVEISSGIKSHDKIEKFMNKIKGRV